MKNFWNHQKQFWKNHWHESEEYSLWFASIFSGLLAVFYALLFKWAEDFSHWMLQHHSYWMLVTTPLAFFVSFSLCYLFAPYARGSGIPQVLACIEQQEKQEKQTGGALSEKVLAFKTIMIKIVASILAVASGGAVGREGPSIHIASAIFYQTGKYFSRHKTKSYLEHWIIAGGAAGIAAAFNTPLGGLVFAIEELSTTHFSKYKSSLIVSVIIAGLVAQSLLGPYLYVGVPSLMNFNFEIAPLCCLVGLVGGSTGTLFGKFIYAIFQWRQKYLKNRYLPLALFAIFAGLFVALCAINIEPSSIGAGKEVIHRLLFEHVEGSPSISLKLLFVRFFSPLISFTAGGSGGVFAPCLAFGAVIGGYIAEVFTSIHFNLLVLLGMIAFLTGFTRTPFTSFVLVMEMTDQHRAIFPMMMSALIAVKVAKWIEAHSFYDKMKRDLLALNA